MILIIDLNTNLRIYKSQPELELLFKKDKTHGVLDLTDNFQEIFTNLPLADEYYLFIGESAGFMDSRVIYIWLSNNHLFNQKEYFVSRANFDPVRYLELSTNSKSMNRKDLAYSREPNIGKK
ncbi:MAG: hypothetical protein ACRCXZ_01475 [Patescibacteria group bacterium]